jgi:Protein of unknown function (DUF2510)
VRRLVDAPYCAWRRFDRFLAGGIGPADGACLREAETLPAPAAPAGWYADPTGRHVYRYWTGNTWTEYVSPGDGTRFIDPLR